MTTVLVDGDIVSYRCAASVNKQVKEIEDWWEQDQMIMLDWESQHGSYQHKLDVEREVAILRADNLMREIINDTGATHHRVFLTGDGNFRKEIYPEYKAHRVQEKPMFLPEVNQHLIDEWNAEVVHGMEADDALGIAMYYHEKNKDKVWQSQRPPNECICASIDKDLLMIPGRHYNFVKKEFTEVTPFQGYYNFYKQCLTGDRTDNIPGLRLGYGPKAAENDLMACTSEKELFEVVRGLYNDDETLVRNAQLLWIKRVSAPSLHGTLLSDLLPKDDMTRN